MQTRVKGSARTEIDRTEMNRNARAFDSLHGDTGPIVRSVFTGISDRVSGTYTTRVGSDRLTDVNERSGCRDDDRRRRRRLASGSETTKRNLKI